jgi:hypothetical protein
MGRNTARKVEGRRPSAQVVANPDPRQPATIVAVVAEEICDFATTAPARDPDATAERFYRADGWAPDGQRRTESVWGAVADELRYRRAL